MHCTCAMCGTIKCPGIGSTVCGSGSSLVALPAWAAACERRHKSLMAFFEAQLAHVQRADTEDDYLGRWSGQLLCSELSLRRRHVRCTQRRRYVPRCCALCTPAITMVIGCSLLYLSCSVTFEILIIICSRTYCILYVRADRSVRLATLGLSVNNGSFANTGISYEFTSSLYPVSSLVVLVNSRLTTCYHISIRSLTLTAANVWIRIYS
jgi:hypothetical protein